MPVVPSVRGPSVAPDVPAQPRAPLEAFGGGQSARPVDFTEAGRQYLRIYQDQKQKADQVAVTDAGAKVSALETQLLYDPDHGALAQRGKNAFGVHEQVSSAWQQSIAGIEAGLTNDEQKAAFQRLAQSHWTTINEQVERHVATERKTYDDEATAAYLANEAHAASQSYQDSARVETSIANQRAAIVDHASRNGLPDEWVQQQTAKVTSATRLSVLEQYLNTGQDLTGSAYLAAHHDDFVGQDLQRAQTLTEAGSTRGESRRQADRITSTATNLTDALKQIDTIQDPKVADATEQRVRRHYADLATADRQDREAAYVRASAAIEQSGGNTDAIPLSDRVKLSPTENADLDRRADEIRNPKGKTNQATYANLINMAALNDATRQQFIHLDLRDPKYQQDLSVSDYHYMLNLQRETRNGIDRAAQAAARRDEASATRDDSKAATAHRSNLRKQESSVVKQLDERQKAVTEKASLPANLQQYKPVPPRVTLPQWMIDSASTDPEYGAYLKMHGADLNQRGPATAPTTAPSAPLTPGVRPPVPGAPIAKPPAGIDITAPARTP